MRTRGWIAKPWMSARHIATKNMTCGSIFDNRVSGIATSAQRIRSVRLPDHLHNARFQRAFHARLEGCLLTQLYRLRRSGNFSVLEAAPPRATRRLLSINSLSLQNLEHAPERLSLIKNAPRVLWHLTLIRDVRVQ